jgi:phosphohistidine phosphatase
MKQLLIIRHAKSSWDFSVLNDFDRPLNERGHNDAPLMVKRLLQKKISIDAFVSSTANRAFTTAAYFAKAYDVKEKNIIKVPELYHAAPKIFYTVITSLNDSLQTVALFSHNPGITEFVNDLTNTRIDNMPTCGIYAIKTDADSWKEFYPAKKKFWFFDYPKNTR